MILVVAPKNADAVLTSSDGYIIGELFEGKKGVEIV